MGLVSEQKQLQNTGQSVNIISERKSDRVSAKMSNAHKGHARHYKHIGWYIQTAALPVKTGIVILLWLCFLIQVIFAIHFSACVYVYIYMCVFACSIM